MTAAGEIAGEVVRERASDLNRVFTFRCGKV